MAELWGGYWVIPGSTPPQSNWRMPRRRCLPRRTRRPGAPPTVRLAPPRASPRELAGPPERPVESWGILGRTRSPRAAAAPQALSRDPAARAPAARSDLPAAASQRPPTTGGHARPRPAGANGSYLVDSASSHMLVSKIKPCMSKYKQTHGETANGSLNKLSFI